MTSRQLKRSAENQKRILRAVDAIHDAAKNLGGYEPEVCISAAARAIRAGTTDADNEEAFAFARAVWSDRFEYWGPC